MTPRTAFWRRAAVATILATAVLLLVLLVRLDGDRTTRDSVPTPASTPETGRPHAVPERRRTPPPPEEAEVPSPDAPPAVDGTQRVLRILDSAGTPVSSVHVTGPGGPRLTDQRGEVAFPAGDTATTVRFFDRDAERVVELRDPVTAVTLDRLPLLFVDAVDGTTGAPLPLARVRIPSGGEGRVVSNDRGVPLAILANGHAVIFARVEPPPGYGALANYGFTGPVASRVSRARWTIPLFPARDLVFVATDAQGRPVEGARVVEATTSLPESKHPCDVTFAGEPAGKDGLVRMTGVPRLPFARLDVRIAKAVEDETGTEWSGSKVGIRLDEVEGTTPQSVVMTLRPVVGRGFGFNSGGVGSVTRFDRGAPLAVRVIQRDGRPAAGVTVACNRLSQSTDADGVVRFAIAPSGSQVVRAFAHGFSPAVASVEVGTQSEIVLHESEQRTVRVLVADEAGQPLPAAQVSASCVDVPGPDGNPVAIGCSIAQIDGAWEWLTPLTGRDGSLVLCVPRGTIEYHAVLGAIESSTRTDVDAVTIVLRAQK
jgi:hypothetical protein